MNVLVKTVSAETVIKGSRFIAELFPCSAQSEARELIKKQKNKYSDATHVCHAFVIGGAAEILGMSDDGEPPGTAGRPMLDVLKGHGCTNTLLTVTRYFGGTLLGTGGLVKAYGGSAKSVLEKADSENAFEPLVAKKQFSFTVAYPFYDEIKRYLSALHVYELLEDFQTEITIKGKIREDESDSFSARVFDITGGKTKVNIEE